MYALSERQKKSDEETLKLVNERFKSGDYISVPLIQRKCRCGYFSASRVFDKLVEAGRIKKGGEPSRISTML